MQIRGRWWWQVVGKGRKEARVPVNQDMLERYAVPTIPGVAASASARRIDPAGAES
ncbi:MAG: hypothetical protein U1F42_04470 [Candidatus Competibacteraceae bacterium]